MFFKLILFVILIKTIGKIDADHPCFDGQREKLNLHLGTKSPYRFVENRNDSVISFNGCEATKIWSIIRHGTRNPSGKIIKKIRTNLITIKNRILHSKTHQLCKLDLEKLREWHFTIDENESSFLTLEGINEMIELAERMQNRFPNLLPSYYDNSTYKFQFTDTQRTRKSFEGFVTGLFGRHNIKKVWHPKPLTKDPVLRFYKLCDRWENDVKRNTNTFNEKNHFFTGEQMQEVFKRIVVKTGVPDLSLNDIQLMYTACAFETAFSQFHESPWCYMFDAQSIKVLEYLEDLKYYWVDGYGYELTWKQACPTIVDMLKHFGSSANPNASFYFSHSGAILKILAHLGLYRDTFLLTHKDFEQERLWRVSKMNTFGSNLAFILFDCKTGPHILSMHQERIVRLPGCPANMDLCHLDIFKFIFKDSLNNCIFNEICRV